MNIYTAKNPSTWVNPKLVEAAFDFKATNVHELSFHAGQRLIVAPREVQQTQKLMNTGWALATIDNKSSGLIPINYVRKVPSSSAPNTINEPHAPAENLKPTTDEPFETQLSGAIESNRLRTEKNDRNMDAKMHDFIANEIQDM